ncbi:hypothetical protein D3C78_1705060 [compost metagenome]
MSLTPFISTSLEPKRAPMNWPSAMQKPTLHTTLPPRAKNSREAMLEVKLSSLVWAVALAMPKPARATKPMAKKEPVPGPKKPS